MELWFFRVCTKQFQRLIIIIRLRWLRILDECTAKVSQFSLLPQGKVEAKERVLNMVNQMDAEGFGNCTNTGACEVECPKGISLENIARMNREYLKSSLI